MAHFRILGKCNTSLHWLSGLLKQLMAVAWDMWLDQNNIKQNTLTAEKQGEIETVNENIKYQFAIGTDNLSSKDVALFT